MFIYSEWEKFCKNISSKNRCIQASKILEQTKDSNWVVIKHDVETNVHKALCMAKIEAKYGIEATYYVQSYLLDGGYNTLQDISSLGHEVSYHYDVMDSNNGDLDAAIAEFRDTINKFSSYGFIVKTICPHGNPVMIRNGWTSNKDFFRSDKVSEMFPDILDIVVQLPNYIGNNFLYISDAGYRWKIIANVGDNDVVNYGDKDLKTYSTLINTITKSNKTIVSTHPHRWENTKIKAIMNLIIFRTLRAIAGNVSSIPLVKNILSKFYYLAKKI